jgi:AcrR family transcriptional regulator
MIAQEAGVDHPLIHYYFGSKEKLFEVVASEINEEFYHANISWLAGIERMIPHEGFNIYLDRLLDYSFKNPEPLQIILLNMAQTGAIEDIPGYQHIIMHIDGIARTLEEKIPLLGSNPEIKTLIHCFINLIITFLGAKSSQAPILDMDPLSSQYREWVKNTLFILFLPWLERIIKISLESIKKKEG